MDVIRDNVLMNDFFNVFIGFTFVEDHYGLLNLKLDQLT